MKKIYTYLTIIAAAAVVLAACSKTRTEDEREDMRDYFLAWMEQNYPGVTPNANGIYIIEETPGSGSVYANQSYAHIDVTVADIEGNISSTTNEKLSKQLGSYKESYYYGPTMSIAGDDVSAGVHYILYGMRKGGIRKAIIPFWLSTYDRYETAEEYFKHSSTSSSNLMYTITLNDFADDVDKWEIDSLQQHLRNFYKSEPDSLSYGLYYYQLTPPADEEEFPHDTVIYINYTGRLLNGQVFDTTLKDTAVVHNIYTSSKTYEPVKVAWAEKAESITMNSSSVISGFAKTLWNMHKYEKGRGYFISSLGYSSSGSGSTIPAYSPLCFEVEIVDKP